MLRPGIQIVLFSATFEDRVVDYATMFAPNANQITLKHEELTVEGIKQMYIDCANDDVKFDTLVRLYGVMTIGSSIIFVKVKSGSARLIIKLINLTDTRYRKEAYTETIGRRPSSSGSDW